MSQFKIHTLKSTPAESKPSLEGAKTKIGTIHNLLDAMPKSPDITNAYHLLNE